MTRNDTNYTGRYSTNCNVIMFWNFIFNVVLLCMNECFVWIHLELQEKYEGMFRADTFRVSGKI